MASTQRQPPGPPMTLGNMRIPVNQLASKIERERAPLGGNLSSALRVFVFEHYRQLAKAKR